MAGSVGVGRAAPRSSPKRYAGTDPPLSLAGPTMADLQRTAELEKFLVEAGLYEGKESAKREEVLSEIGQIVKEWVKHLTRKKGYAEQLVERANAVLFTFGSYRLGVSASFSSFICNKYYCHSIIEIVLLNGIQVPITECCLYCYLFTFHTCIFASPLLLLFYIRYHFVA